MLSAPAAPDESTGTNASEAERVGLGPVAAVFPRAGFEHATSQEVAGTVWTVLGTSA